MKNYWIEFGKGFLLVFSITDKESLEDIKKRRDKIIKGKHKNKVPMVLVGNKQDLEDERQISYDEAKQLADSWKIDYIETSAKTNLNCKEAFEILIKKISIQIKSKKSSCYNSLIFLI